MKQTLMEKDIPDSVKTIFEKFVLRGFEIYAVGGSVRDLLLARPTANWDFTTNATPSEIQEIFPESFYNNSFGTVGVNIESGEVYEITTFRTERGYTDKRHPDQVSWGKTLEEDLARREFTISAIALSYVSGKLSIIDPYYGQEDLKKRIVKAIGDPQVRFEEDALRLIRGIRIATQLGFAIEERTFDAMKTAAPNITNISTERIRDELIKILSTNYPADGIMLLFSSGLLKEILPELTQGYGVLQAKHHKYDVFKHSVESLRNCPSGDWLVRLATLIHDIGKPVVARGEGADRTFHNHEVTGATIAKNIADRLHFKREWRDKLYLLVRWHQFSVDEFQTDSAIRRFIRRVGSENLREMFDLRIGDRLGGGCVTATSWRLKKYMERTIEVQKHIPSVNDLKVDGHDVMKILNVPPGPIIGKILNQLFEEIVEDPSKNEREYLLKRVGELGNG